MSTITLTSLFVMYAGSFLWWDSRYSLRNWRTSALSPGGAPIHCLFIRFCKNEKQNIRYGETCDKWTSLGVSLLSRLIKGCPFNTGHACQPVQRQFIIIILLWILLYPLVHYTPIFSLHLTCSSQFRMETFCKLWHGLESHKTCF